jgi:ribonuclease P protein component
MFTIVYSPLSSFHASVVVSKKVHKQAVVRNKVRRQMYAQLRAKLNQKHTGVFIVIVKPGYLKFDKHQVPLELTQVVGRILKPA